MDIKKIITGRKINISGIDKRELTKALWNCSKPITIFPLGYENRVRYDEDYFDIMMYTKKIDILCGRYFGIEIWKDEICPLVYDHYNGKDACERVVDFVKNGVIVCDIGYKLVPGAIQFSPIILHQSCIFKPNDSKNRFKLTICSKCGKRRNQHLL